MDPVPSTDKPLCGVETVLPDDIETMLAALAPIGGIIAALISLLGLEGLGIVKPVALGLGIPLSVLLSILAYVALQINVITVLGINWNRKCRMANGNPYCVSGIVNTVHDAEIPSLGIGAQHPHMDLVVKPATWPQIKDRSEVKYVYCSDTGTSGLRSPMVKVFFKSERVCTVLAAAFGGSFAAPLVAIVAVNGIFSTLGAAGLAGALAFFAFALLLWLAALVAGAIAAAIAAAATEPMAPEAGVLDPEDEGGQALPEGYGVATTIALGDLLTVNGPLVIEGNYNNSLAIRFVTDAYLLGSYSGVKGRPYNHVDAMTAIPDDMDICLPPQRPDPEGGSGTIVIPPEDDPPTPLPVP